MNTVIQEARLWLAAGVVVAFVVTIFWLAVSTVDGFSAAQHKEPSPDAWKPYIALHHARAQVVEGFEK